MPADLLLPPPPPLFATLSAETLASLEDVPSAASRLPPPSSPSSRTSSATPPPTPPLSVRIDSDSSGRGHLPGEAVVGTVSVSGKLLRSLRTLSVRLRGFVVPGPVSLNYACAGAIFDIEASVDVSQRGEVRGLRVRRSQGLWAQAAEGSRTQGQGSQARSHSDSEEPPSPPQPVAAFAFAVSLPARSLPPSFESPHGRIRYSLLAVLNAHHAASAPFKVACCTDTAIPRFLRPVEVSVKSLPARRRWPSLAPKTAAARLPVDPASLTLTLDRCGFRAGEVIDLNVVIANPASLTISLRDILITETVDYRISVSVSKAPLRQLTPVLISPSPEVSNSASIAWTLSLRLPRSLNPTIYSSLLALTHALSLSVSLVDESQTVSRQLPTLHHHSNTLTASLGIVIGARAATIARLSLMDRHRHGSVDTLPPYSCVEFEETSDDSVSTSQRKSLGSESGDRDSGMGEGEEAEDEDDEGLVLSLDSATATAVHVDS